MFKLVEFPVPAPPLPPAPAAVPFSFWVAPVAPTTSLLGPPPDRPCGAGAEAAWP